MKRKKTFAGILLVLAFPAVAFCEEEFSQILKKAEQLKNEQKYVQALNELTWATTELQKLHVEKLKSFFPATVEGLQPGEFETNNALGFIVVERAYSSSTGAKIKATMGGSAASEGSAAAGMGALAGLASMASMMGGMEGSEVVRIHDTRANIMNQNGRLELNLPLSSGMFFKVEEEGGKGTKDQLVAVASGLDVKGLNSYLGTK